MPQKEVWCSGKVAPLRGQGSDAIEEAMGPRFKSWLLQYILVFLFNKSGSK